MLAEERFSQILALLAEKHTATVQELCEALNVSESTIRRDLLELDRQGRVNKVHGGATLPSSQFRADEPTMEAKETLAVSQKSTIAKAAAALIQADDFVYLDAGSTTLAVARAVSGAALDAHYVTNGIAHARLLAQKGCRVFVPGGLLRPQTEAIIGAAAMAALQQYNFTKAFLGANGIDLVAGFTTPDPEEAAVKACAARRAHEIWFLADDTKFGSIYPAVIAGLQDGSILTNRCPDPRYRQQTLVKEAEVLFIPLHLTPPSTTSSGWTVRCRSRPSTAPPARIAYWAARASMYPACWPSWGSKVWLSALSRARPAPGWSAAWPPRVCTPISSTCKRG